jgi:hypothetical protein
MNGGATMMHDILLANSETSLILSTNPENCKREKRIRQQYPLFLKGLFVLDIAASRCGADSNDSIDSPE